MVNIPVYTSRSNSSLVSTPLRATDQSPGRSTEATNDASTSTSGTVSTVSTLARQLSEAATRAQTRDPSFRPAGLDLLTGDKYFASKAQHDAEVPEADAPELLIRAKQATAFLNRSDSNPFKGLSRDQLNLIAYDDSGSFTLNERRAAWQETTAASASGRDLMVSRLFGGKEPAVSDGAQGMSMTNIGRLSFEFLTRDDRDLLSQMYAYAKEQGADLNYVDNLAREMGDYRQHDDGRSLSNFNNGNSYDTEGYQLTVSFTDKDAATASSILSGSAINSTRFDQGFLQHLLDPGFGAIGLSSSLQFLEKMVIKFSSEGATQSSIGSQFATYTPAVSLKDNMVMTTSHDVRLAPFHPDITKVDGVWTLTEKGLAKGITMDEVFGRSRRPVSDPVDQEQPRYILDALTDSSNQDTSKQTWLSGLFKMIERS